ncbi:uncharacterized protein [Diadema setosum]|uniref:uncharacterized protein n=1 Tax=Diadema setosum TaxID=31175 RepID=UPI003B3A2A9F
MSEDSSRRKSNNPSRVLQSTDDNDIIDIPDDDGIQVMDSKRWYHQDENVDHITDGVMGFEVRGMDGGEAGAALGNEVDGEERGESHSLEVHEESTGHTSSQSILQGGRFSLNNRRHSSGSTFIRQRQFIEMTPDSYQSYPMDLEPNQVRRQQRAVEPFVCRTTSTSGKKDACMQFPDDELSVLREENEALRKENTELRNKVDRLVETIALNDALPSLLASLRGEHPQEAGSGQGTSATLPAVQTPSSTPSTITISKCHSLANEEPAAYTISSTPGDADGAPPISEIATVMVPQEVPKSGVPTTVSQMSIVDRMAIPQTSQPPVTVVEQELLPPLTIQQVSQQPVHIPRAPVVPVLAPSIQMTLANPTPMVPPGAPSQLAMLQQSLPSQVPQSPSQVVLSGMAPPTMMRMRGKVPPRAGAKQTEETIEITLSNRVKVDKKLLDRCNHTNFRKLTSDLLMCLFSRKVLSRSTLGGTSHSISRTTGLPTNKTRLDPDKVEAIIDYVQRVTGVPVRAVKDAIRTKLNNEAKRMHRQIIFKSRSVHYPGAGTEDPT